MSSDLLDALTNKLSNTQVCGEGVSFVGKSLKLNNADDGKSIVVEARMVRPKITCIVDSK